MYINPKEARIRLGLSQSEMAKACNTSIGTVTKWDQGQREPRGQAIQLIKLMLWLKKRDLLTEWLKEIAG